MKKREFSRRITPTKISERPVRVDTPLFRATGRKLFFDPNCYGCWNSERELLCDCARTHDPVPENLLSLAAVAETVIKEERKLLDMRKKAAWMNENKDLLSNY